MIRAIIISGDWISIDRVEAIISAYCPNLSLLAKAADIKTGLAVLNQHQSDLVFIDTYLNDGSGFELLDHFSLPDFKTIFISDYAEYAIKAIDYHAIGYLLKPLNDQKFISAAQRAIEMISHEEKIQVGLLEGNLKKMQEQENLMLRTSDQIHLVRFSDLVRVEADGNYSSFHVADGRKVMVSKPMKEYEEKLMENGFFRIHKSHIINIKMMICFDKSEGGYVIMSDQSRIPVSSRKWDVVMELFDNLSRSGEGINTNV